MAEGQAALPEADMQQPKRQLQFFTRSYFKCNKGLFLCAECYANNSIGADT